MGDSELNGFQFVVKRSSSCFVQENDTPVASIEGVVFIEGLLLLAGRNS